MRSLLKGALRQLLFEMSNRVGLEGKEIKQEWGKLRNVQKNSAAETGSSCENNIKIGLKTV